MSDPGSNHGPPTPQVGPPAIMHAETVSHSDGHFTTEKQDYQCDPGKSESSTAWEAVMETLQNHTKDVVGTWKDELDNILIFAGLFSAVVTTFAAQYFPVLQPSSEDTSDTPSPPQLHVNINVLWFSSLTLSLLAALFAIAVQQWLRQLRIPLDLAVHDALRLQQFRHEGLWKWQVPLIISVLPILLQLAVVLFLIGMLLLLKSLNFTLFVTFTAIAGAGILPFLVASFIPLLDAECAYKSPLIPAIYVILQWVFYYPPTLTAIGICFLGLHLGEVFVKWQSNSDPSKIAQYRDNYFMPFKRRARDYVDFQAFRNHIIVDVVRFWQDRELEAIAQLACAHDMNSCCPTSYHHKNPHRIHCEVLCRALSLMPYGPFSRCKHLLERFPGVIKVRSSLLIVMHILGSFEDVRDVLECEALPIGRQQLYDRIGQRMSMQHASMMLEALSTPGALSMLKDLEPKLGDWDSNKKKLAVEDLQIDVTRILVLIHYWHSKRRGELNPSEEVYEQYLAQLWEIRRFQHDSNTPVLTAGRCIPTLLIWKSFNELQPGLQLRGDQKTEVQKWATACLSEVNKLSYSLTGDPTAGSDGTSAAGENMGPAGVDDVPVDAISTVERESQWLISHSVELLQMPVGRPFVGSGWEIIPGTVFASTATFLATLSPSYSEKALEKFIKDLETFLCGDWKSRIAECVSRRFNNPVSNLLFLDDGLASIRDSLPKLATPAGTSASYNNVKAALDSLEQIRIERSPLPLALPAGTPPV